MMVIGSFLALLDIEIGSVCWKDRTHETQIGKPAAWTNWQSSSHQSMMVGNNEELRGHGPIKLSKIALIVACNSEK